MKETAVEWLNKTMYSYIDYSKNKFELDYDFIDQLIKEALELEKKHIINAWELEGDEYVRTGIDYYEKTFKK